MDEMLYSGLPCFWDNFLSIITIIVIAIVWAASVLLPCMIGEEMQYSRKPLIEKMAPYVKIGGVILMILITIAVLAALAC